MSVDFITRFSHHCYGLTSTADNLENNKVKIEIGVLVMLMLYGRNKISGSSAGPRNRQVVAHIGEITS